MVNFIIIIRKLKFRINSLILHTNEKFRKVNVEMGSDDGGGKRSNVDKVRNTYI